MLVHGPVRAPMDATKGKATMLVELPPSSRFRSYPTSLDVVIE
jgi:hypothetical protein